MSKILVIGSSNVDYTTYLSSFPRVGETIHGLDFSSQVGGKGANQACATSLAGGEALFLSIIGNDIDGQFVEKTLNDKKVPCKFIKSNKHTGCATILVNEKTGENQIVVVPGSNFTFTSEMLEQYEDYFKSCEYVLLQLEIPLLTIEKAVEMAKKYQKKVILNPAPAKELTSELLSKIDYLTPNETELSYLTNMPSDTKEQCLLAMEHLLEKGVKNVVVTRGKHGSILKNKDGVKEIKAMCVDAIDSTAAGDCYNGVFVAYLSNGFSVVEALEKASIASAISVTRKGAISSLPSKDEIDNYND